NTRDALEVLRFSLYLGDFHGLWFIADANQDKNINAKDSLLIQHYSLKLPSDDNIGKPYLVDFFY
ncbi:MAG: hypothetical protein IIT49_04425, partial [Clostridia bacterium]|nr:hypothetical protein [Clostridia bacterium]